MPCLLPVPMYDMLRISPLMRESLTAPWVSRRPAATVTESPYRTCAFTPSGNLPIGPRSSPRGHLSAHMMRCPVTLLDMVGSTTYLDSPQEKLFRGHSSKRAHPMHFGGWCRTVPSGSNDIIRHMKPYSGNVADSVMDRETIDGFGRIFSEEGRRITLVGDCKLPSAGNICRIRDLGMRLVSGCSENFKGDAWARTTDWALGTEMHSTSNKGLWMADTDMEVELEEGRTGKLRFVAFRIDSRVENAISRIRSKAGDDSKSLVE